METESIWVGVVATIAVTILGGLWMLLRKFVMMLMDKMDVQDNQKQAVHALLAGMAKQQPIAKAIKKAAADNKITSMEAESLEAAAWETAKGLAQGPAKDIVLNWTSEKVSSLVKQLLAGFKSKKDK